MGNFIKIKCDCGEEQFLTFGRGFIPIEDGVFEEIQKNPLFSNLKKNIISENDITNAEYRLYYCKNCNILAEHFYFKIPKLPKYRLKYNCSKCSKLMISINNVERILCRDVPISCPKCEKQNIVKEDNTNIELGFWD